MCKASRTSPFSPDYSTQEQAPKRRRLNEATSLKRSSTPQYSINEEFNKTVSINLLPSELILKIFSSLNLAALGVAGLVCKQWDKSASNPNVQKIVIHNDIAFGKKNWEQCFGDNSLKDENSEEEFSSLPDTIGDILKSPCHAFPGKKVKDTHMLVWIPKTINEQPLSLYSLGKLADSYFPYRARGCGFICCVRFICSPILNEQLLQSIEKSHWVLMTKDLLQGSLDKNYADQQAMVADLAKRALIDYRVPEGLEAAACMLTRIMKFKSYSFNYDLWSFTRCQKNIINDHFVIGGFRPMSLSQNTLGSHNSRTGMTALRRL